MRSLASLVLVLGLTTAAATGAPGVAQAGTVSFTIDRVFELQCDEGFGEDCPNDFYAKVFIDGQDTGRQPASGEVEDNDFNPNWRFTANVPDDREIVPIRVLLNDQDDGSSDDEIDISTAGSRWLDLSVEQATGFLTPGIPGSKGEGHGSGLDSAQIFYTVETSLARDTDGDGLTDGVELRGFRNAPGGARTELNAMGADPCRKTVALEIDWFKRVSHDHRPSDGALNEVRGAFDTAPVPAVTGPACPYAGYPRKPGGIDLITDRGNAVDYTTLAEPNINDSGTGNSVKFASLRASHFTPGRRPWFHYVVFGHNQNDGDSTSGLCCEENRDLIVTLGSWTGSVGTDREQSGTLIHELGHALGLAHGGNTGINYKPNYLSAMNYRFQFGIFDADPATADAGIIDYSRSVLPTLVETSLAEPAGLGGTVPARFGTIWRQPNLADATGPESGPVDWNGDGDTTDTGVTVNLNDITACVGPGPNGVLNTAAAAGDTAGVRAIFQGGDDDCDTARSGDDTQDLAVGSVSEESASGRRLVGFEDWSKLTFRAQRPATGTPAPAPHRDITEEQARLLEEQREEADLDQFQLSINDAEVTEGDSGTQDATLTVTLSKPSSQTVTVDVATVGDSATAPADFQARSTKLTFAPGQTQRQFTAPVVGDTTPEGDESFLVRLSAPTAARIADAEGRISIKADPEPSLSIGDARVEEDDTTVRFRVALTEANNTPVRVRFVTADGTAVAPADYGSTSGELEFPVGGTERMIEVAIREDTIDEIDEETFSVRLSDIVNANLDDREGVGTIRDDDRNGSFTCRAAGIRLGTFELGVANGPALPCQDGAGAGIPLQQSFGGVTVRVEGGGALTDQTPDDLTGTKPRAGDRGLAHAEATNVTITAGPNVLRVSGFTSDAKAECSATNAPPGLASSSRVTLLNLNGQPVVTLTGQATIPLELATLRVNERVMGPTEVVQRALVLDNVIGPDVVLGETRAGYAGTAVHPTGNPCVV